MIQQDLVSVIIPTFNRSNLLKRAILSVINQTYKNIEIIIVDDNEPNSEEHLNTVRIIDQINDSRINYIKLKKNSGGAIARNKGISESRGKYICFLDDDDEFLENKIELQINKFISSKDDLAVVGGYAHIIDVKGNIKKIEKNNIKGNVFFYQLKKNVCTTSIAMIKREVLIKSGGFEPIPSSQEHLMFIKLFKENPYYDFIDQVVVKINHHEGSRISTNPNKPVGALILYEKVKELSKEYKYSNEQINEIKKAHLKNIITSYMSINNRKKALEYLSTLSKIDTTNIRDLSKMLLMIVLGLDLSEKIKQKKINTLEYIRDLNVKTKRG